ncbi:hypothetical protein BGZ92_006725, partial [Podila epicladia]
MTSPTSASFSSTGQHKLGAPPPPPGSAAPFTFQRPQPSESYGLIGGGVQHPHHYRHEHPTSPKRLRQDSGHIPYSHTPHTPYAPSAESPSTTIPTTPLARPNDMSTTTNNPPVINTTPPTT